MNRATLTLSVILALSSFPIASMEEDPNESAKDLRIAQLLADYSQLSCDFTALNDRCDTLIECCQKALAAKKEAEEEKTKLFQVNDLIARKYKELTKKCDVNLAKIPVYEASITEKIQRITTLEVQLAHQRQAHEALLLQCGECRDNLQRTTAALKDSKAETKSLQQQLSIQEQKKVKKEEELASLKMKIERQSLEQKDLAAQKKRLEEQAEESVAEIERTRLQCEEAMASADLANKSLKEAALSTALAGKLEDAVDKLECEKAELARRLAFERQEKHDALQTCRVLISQLGQMEVDYLCQLTQANARAYAAYEQLRAKKAAKAEAKRVFQIIKRLQAWIEKQEDL